MIILTLRTDNPQAEIGLYQDDKQQTYQSWEAHRELSSTILTRIHQLLQSHGSDWKDIDGIVCFSGPGSFTGLRIGATVANTLATTLDVPVVGTNGEDWIFDGIEKINEGEISGLVVPNYGRGAHITTPRK